jgi:hypothetical protein
MGFFSLARRAARAATKTGKFSLIHSLYYFPQREYQEIVDH